MNTYICTKPITTLDEFYKCELIYDKKSDKIYHRGWSHSWQFRCVAYGVKMGNYHKVIKK